LDVFIDSIRTAVFKDTGQLCSICESYIKQSKAYVALSNYVFWENNKYWYRVGDDGKNTAEFVNEFLVAQKIKSAAIVAPPPEKKLSVWAKQLPIFIYKPIVNLSLIIKLQE
jgi:hypothetical protein